jgi:hypothetical protein
MPTEGYIGLLGVVLGWLLNEASRWIWARRAERKSVAQALAALLEIRHRVRATPLAIKMLSGRPNLPTDAEAQLNLILSQWFPTDRGRLQRYSDAVAHVAAQNPEVDPIFQTVRISGLALTCAPKTRPAIIWRALE